MEKKVSPEYAKEMKNTVRMRRDDPDDRSEKPDYCGWEEAAEACGCK